MIKLTLTKYKNIYIAHQKTPFRKWKNSHHKKKTATTCGDEC